MKTPQNNHDNPTGKKNIKPLAGMNEKAREVEEQNAEVTREDLEALGSDNLSPDLGEDEELKKRTHPAHFSGDDLDVPGAELDDENESIGSEDEENNSWSLGGDNHEDLEEDHAAESDDPRLG